MKKNLFNIDPIDFDKWKSKTHYICQTPGMVLFMALESLHQKIKHNNGYLNGPMPKPRKFNNFPGKITDCRCKYCRYHRIFKK